MKANELRIGNYLQSRENRIFKVTIEDLQFIEAGSLCLPIQLTEELLLKCGFEIKKSGRFGNEYHFKNFSLYTSKEKTICFVWDDKYIIDILYIHQLQNIFFALTNQELKIIL